MKDIHKSPLFYYILIPAVVGLWPLLVWAVYLPRAQKGWETDVQQYEEAQKTIRRILELDPDRVKATLDAETADFDYIKEINKVATLSKIPSNNYKLAVKAPPQTKGRKTQSCHVRLDNVRIEDFAKFFATLQFRWPKLESSRVGFVRQKGSPNLWQIDIDYTYYY